MVDDFINRKQGTKKVTYLDPLLEPILKETYGIILYQEQTMQIVSALAGFDMAQADFCVKRSAKKFLRLWRSSAINLLPAARKIIFLKDGDHRYLI